ncbi:hypothetical protein IWW41_000902 [Coemansia sp. RSA 2522]|nr:hypothetical protein IWW41_000902 [Coemansia sp. RSA 2522]
MQGRNRRWAGRRLPRRGGKPAHSGRVPDKSFCEPLVAFALVACTVTRKHSSHRTPAPQHISHMLQPPAQPTYSNLDHILIIARAERIVLRMLYMASDLICRQALAMRCNTPLHMRSPHGAAQQIGEKRNSRNDQKRLKSNGHKAQTDERNHAFGRERHVISVSNCRKRHVAEPHGVKVVPPRTFAHIEYCRADEPETDVDYECCP